KSDSEMDIDEAFIEDVSDMQTSLEDSEQIEEVGPDLEKEMSQSKDALPDGFLADSDKAIKLDVTLDGNTYAQSALNTIDQIRDDEGDILKNYGFEADENSVYIAEKTAEQLEFRDMNV